MSDITTNDTNRNALGEDAYRSLADLLAERRRDVAELEAMREEAKTHEQERIRQAAIDYAEDWMQRHISRELCAALNATPACDQSRLIDSERSFDHISRERWAACILLDLSDAPEIDPEATSGDLTSGRWQIRRSWSNEGTYWEVYHRPTQFVAGLTNTASDVCLDEDLLDALLTYPEWRKKQRRP